MIDYTSIDDNLDLVSIIIPVFKVEKYIHRCLNSIINQTYRNIEVILIDDGSPDGSAAICEKFAVQDKRLKIYHKTNGGLSDARNYGIKHANGKYIVCVDSDDFVDCDYIEYLHNLIKKYGTSLSICRHRTIYNNGSVKDYGSQGDTVLTNKECLERMLYHNGVDTSAWAKMYKSELFAKVEYPIGRIFEDIGTTYLLMLECEEIAVGYESKYNYVFHNSSIVNSAFSIKKFDLLDMTDKMAIDVLAVYPELGDAVERRQVYARFSTLNQMLGTNKYVEKKQEIIEYIRSRAKSVFFNKKTPKRDKIAILLLAIDYTLYKKCWLLYQKRLMKD